MGSWVEEVGNGLCIKKKIVINVVVKVKGDGQAFPLFVVLPQLL
jgi:hypothetical protein